MSKSTKTVKSAPKSLASGYRDGGNYHAIIATLETMGVNKTFPYSTFASKIEKTWSGWKEFAAVKPRNPKTAKDTDGRLLQNCRVLQRTNDYAAPLLKSGAVIDIAYEGNELTIRLNTKSKKPITPGRAPKAEVKTAAPKAVKAPKVIKSAKSSKPKPSTSKSPILEGREAIAALKKAK